ncbi:aromatic amino acid lyase, partial [Hafnia paralvei]|uniref:aromatic amino acid lyase n=1 Tax=Hafnia paralvei TaxID=546367 RepID=UPI000DFECF19
DENKGLFHAFKAAQITVTALCSEINFMSGPVSIHSRPTESLNQDKVSLGTISARKLSEAIDLLYLQYSIHLLAVAQAIDLIGVDQFSSMSKKVHHGVRKISKFVNEDRALAEEVILVANYLKNSILFD